MQVRILPVSFMTWTEFVNDGWLYLTTFGVGELLVVAIYIKSEFFE